MKHRPSDRVVRLNAYAQLTPSAVFALSIPVALLWSPVASRWMWVSLVALSPLVGRWANTRIAAAEARAT
jgi:hypothetical protein